MTSANNKTIQLASDLPTYFENEVQNTAQKQGLTMSQPTARYLAQVLAKFADTKNYLVENPNEPEAGRSSFPTLAIMWMESLQTPPAEQFFRLQQLGDIALFTTGFFAERLDRKLIDQDYYRAMGEQAYERAGKIRESLASERALNVFFELASSFTNYVEIFAELSDQSMMMSDREVLKLYEKWLRTKNFRIQRMLGEAGIIAAQPAPKDPFAGTGSGSSGNGNLS
jgi:hypothetical protein